MKLPQALIVMISLILYSIASAPMLAATSFLRELAKSKARAYIVVSGPEAMEVGKILQASLKLQPDNSHRPKDKDQNKPESEPFPILTVEEAERQAESASSFGGSSLICLIVERELPNGFPSVLTAALPVTTDELQRNQSVIKAIITQSSPKKGLAFAVSMCAPDRVRLERLYKLFSDRITDSYNALPFQSNFRTNRVAVFSEPDQRDFLSRWGQISGETVWNEIEWHSLEERDGMTPESLAERSEVYFLDRSKKNVKAPKAAQAILDRHSLKEMTVLIAKGEGDNPGSSVIVVSAPTNLALQRKAMRYSNWDALTSAIGEREMADLRSINRSTLLVTGSDLSDATHEQIRISLAQEMRQNLHLNVEERGSLLTELQKEVLLQNLQGSPDTAKLLRRKTNLRYIWLFELTGYSENTSYRPEEEPLTKDPGEFSETKPVEPSDRKGLFGLGGKKSPEQIAKDKQQYEIDLRKYEDDKREYDRAYETEPCQWERRIQSTCDVHVQGVLRLVDLQNDDTPAHVMWERECSRDDETHQLYKSDRVTVNGHANRPNSLDTPPSSNEITPDLIRQTAIDAAKTGLDFLEEDAVLPGDTPSNKEDVSVQPVDNLENDHPDTTNNGSAPPPPSRDALQVVAVGGIVVTINAGSNRGIRQNDRVGIALKTRSITDPTTHEVLRTDTLEALILKVTRVTELTADAIPVNPAENGKVSQIAAGMAAKTWHPAVVPPKPPQTPKPKKKPVAHRSAKRR